MRTIALVDHTKKHRPPAGALEAIAEALTIQVERDFAPAWGAMPTQFTVGGRGEKIHFFDTEHQATDFGWHIVDAHGRPYAHVFVSPSISAGSDWTTGEDSVSASASHEALEMLADPAANEYCLDDHRRLWSREVCDPVQADTYRIRAGGMSVVVSDFVLPAYFNPWGTRPFDHLDVLKKPFTLAKGGYGVFERSTADHEREGRHLAATFDDAVPDWLRRRKLEGWGRTYWRLKLNP